MRLGARRVTFPNEPGPMPESVGVILAWGWNCALAGLVILLCQAARFAPLPANPVCGLASIPQLMAVGGLALASCIAGIGAWCWLIELVLPQRRRGAAHWWRSATLGIILVPVAIALTVFGTGWIAKTAQGRVMRRAEPVIGAIRRYQADHGDAPPTLNSIVPAYLREVPEPGIASAQPFWFSRETDPGTSHRRDEWVLSTRWATPVLDECLLFYLPSENYPVEWGGQPVERIGRWAMVSDFW